MSEGPALAAVPVGRTVVRFRFPDVAPRLSDWWLVISAGEADVCDEDPGYDVAVTVTSDVRAESGGGLAR